MPNRTTNRSGTQGPASDEHRLGGKNPRNSPVQHQDAPMPQPNAPAQSERQRRQDHQPVNPEPLLEHVEETEGDKLRELRNG